MLHSHRDAAPIALQSSTHDLIYFERWLTVSRNITVASEVTAIAWDSIV